MSEVIAAAPPPALYWEERARRYAGSGDGLQAVCSYGMPAFYNVAIDMTQRLALDPWLAVPPRTGVLDVACGVGRWSRLLARRGARVTGVDLAPTMVEEARRRAERDGVASNCRFLQADLAELDLGARFPLVLGVTVLQHIMDPTRFQAAVERLARHLAPGGRAVLLEAAPSHPTARWDSVTFTARTEADYRGAFERAGLRCVRVTGVDPMPLKIRFLPRYRSLPRPAAIGGLAALTALTLPIELLLGRSWVSSSWHKVFVLERAE